MISLLEFFDAGRDIERGDIKRNKYFMNAYNKKLSNYKLLTVGDVVKKGWGQQDVPGYILRFIQEHGEVLLIANIINKRVTQVQVRSIEEKNFYVWGRQASIPYGLGMMKEDFTYGDWVILTEGASDRDAIIEFYPNVLAILSDGLSLIQKNFILQLTNRIILMYDNDKEGKKGMNRDRRLLRREGVQAEKFLYPSGVGDPGDLLELRYNGEYFEAEQFEEYLKRWLDNIIGGIKSE